MPPQRGVTLIELLIGVAILGILLVLGLPAFNSILQNAKLRNAADSIQNALQLARAEAVRRNARVQFVLTDSDVTAANIDPVAESATGKNWMVRVFQPGGGAYSAADFIQAQFGDEAYKNAVINSGVGSITFDGLGRTDLAATNTFQVTNPVGGTCVQAGGPMRCLNVVVDVGGRIKMCDPSITTAGDSRAC